MGDKGQKQPRRSGAVTGARIILTLQSGNLPRASAGALAEALGMEESYVRRVCRKLKAEGLVKSKEVPQHGTPPVNVFSVIMPE